MSGGSMDYLYSRIEDAYFALDTPERRAFKKHLDLIAKACKAIEWVDSCDSAEGSENEAIMACISLQDVLNESIQSAIAVRDELIALIDKAAQKSKPLINLENNTMDTTQDIFDKMLAEFRKERSRTQMTLGQLIDRLREFDLQAEIEGLCKPHSYRGYYTDLAFESCPKRKVCDILEDAKSCVDKSFYGYKGGDFVMRLDTPVWLSDYGTTGTRLMDIEDDGRIITADEDEE